MWLYLAPDSDLYAFSGAPRTFQLWLRYPHPIPPVALQDRWGELEALLASQPSVTAEAPLSPSGADWSYPAGADGGAHALSSPSTGRLLQAIEPIGRPEVEAYVRQRAVAEASLAGGVAPPPDELAARTEALAADLEQLKELCRWAVKKGYGLIMAFREEPAAGPG